MKDRVITWTGTSGRVCSDGILFDVDKKPNLGFEYDTLYYEPLAAFNFYTTSSKDAEGQDVVIKVELTEDNVEACIKYCDEFIEKEDYEVAAYNSDNVFVAVVMKSAAIANGVKYSITERPTTPIAKFDEATGKFAPIYAAFKDDGFPLFNITAPTDDMVLFLTLEEWKLLPERPSFRYALDFATDTWKDNRELDRVKSDALMTVRLYFEHEAIRTNSGFRTSLEMSQWSIQEQEASAYLKDNTVSTPFLDGFLSKNPTITKLDLCERIISDYEAATLKAQGEQHGEMYSYIYRIKDATTNAAVDAITDEVFARTKKYKLINRDTNYPTEAAKNGEETIVMVGGIINHGIGSL